MSIRQKIEDILKEDPNISIGELRNQLPEINPGSLKADFNKLKRKLNGPVARKKTKSEPKKTTRKKSVQQQVSEYLDKNTEASFDTLKSAFPDINPNSLSAYKSLWKKKQPKQIKDAVKVEAKTVAKKQPSKNKPVAKKDELDNAVKKLEKPAAKQLDKPVKKKDKPVKEMIQDKPVRKDDTELINSLKETIAAQEKTIQTMNRSIELLNPESDAELKGLTLSEIKSVAVAYLKSIKELPSKLRG